MSGVQDTIERGMGQEFERTSIEDGSCEIIIDGHGRSYDVSHHNGCKNRSLASHHLAST